jgi:hypothetical protein
VDSPSACGCRNRSYEQWFGGRRLSLLILAVSMECAQAVAAPDLEREHTPGMLEPSHLAPRAEHLHPFRDDGQEDV